MKKMAVVILATVAARGKVDKIKPRHDLYTQKSRPVGGPNLDYQDKVISLSHRADRNPRRSPNTGHPYGK